MRRICTTLAIASSLLVAAAPAQAAYTVGHRHEVRPGAKHAQFTPKSISRVRTTNQVRGFPYGRT